MDSETVSSAVLYFVIFGWLLFAAVFLLRKRPPGAPERKRDRMSIAGIVVQMAAYALVWSVKRRGSTPIVDVNMAVTIILAAVTVALTAASIWIVVTSVRTLGKQWSLAARLVEGHALITTGPYSVVRHPIYTGMLGMLAATGLALSHWAACLAGIVVFLIGTAIRVRSEERLLRAQFGRTYEEYAERVPALLPLPRPG